MITIVVVAVMSIILFLLPAWIAYARNHRQRMAIAVLNIIGGWTGLLWLAALVWSLTSDTDIPAKSPIFSRAMLLLAFGFAEWVILFAVLGGLSLVVLLIAMIR